MGIRHGCSIGLAVGLVTLMNVAAAEGLSPFNPSSHDAAFLYELLGERVMVVRWPNFNSGVWKHRREAAVYYHDTEGEAVRLHSVR